MGIYSLVQEEGNIYNEKHFIKTLMQYNHTDSFKLFFYFEKRKMILRMTYIKL